MSPFLRGPDAEFIRHDLDELYARDRARGMSAWRAHARHARRLFGSALSVWRADREQPRVPGGEWLREVRGGTMLRDLRFALRLFRKHPAPIGIAIGGLALAIGVVSSVFTIVDVTMLRPYVMDEPASVVSVGWAHGHGWPYWSYPMFLKMRDEATRSRVEASTLDTVRFSTVSATGGDSRRRILFVSGGYLQMLGGRPSLGRALEPSDDAAGAPPVIVVSHRFWSTELNGDASVVGKTVWLNGSAVTLVGVLQADFTGPVKSEIRPSIWAPFAAFDDVLIGQPSDAVSRTTVEVIARLAPGVATYAAQADLSAIVKRSTPSGSTSSASAAGPAVWLYGAASPIDGQDAADSYLAIAAIFGIVGLVLALACANTANLLLAAATTRMPEMGVRLALGAGTRRLVRQMVNESLLLGLMAGGLGFLFAVWFVPVLGAMLGLSPELNPAPDARALLFTVGVALVCGLGAGLSPARHGARGNLLAALKSQSGSTAVPSRLRTSFVGFQAAVSIFLLVAAALLARTAILMTRADIGFDVDRLLTVSLERQRAGADEAAYIRTVLAAVREVPSVERASVTQHEPWGYSLERDRFTFGGTVYQVNVNRSDADFFPTAGVRILRGRAFTPDEVNHEAQVALISYSVARAFFGGSDPIGQSLSNVPSKELRLEPATIIGVVGDALLTPMDGQVYGSIYRPISRKRANPPSLLLRTANPRVAARAVEDALRRVDPRVPPTTAIVRDGLDAFLGNKRTLAWLAAPTAVLAVVLAVLGVFGVTAFVVSQRTQEVSLRMALGASSADVLRLLVTDGLRPVIVGLGAGLGVVLLAAQFTARMFNLSGISPHDPLSIGGATAILLAGALVAVLIPARRAAKTDPAGLLRQV